MKIVWFILMLQSLIVKILIGEVTSVDLSEPFAHEKLSPVLALYKAEDFDTALDMADRLVKDGGYGHTASLYINPLETEKLERFASRMKTCRILVNTPSSQGGNRRSLQLQARAFADTGMRFLWRQLRVRKRGDQASAEHQNGCRKERKYAVVQSAPEGLFQKGLPARRPGQVEEHLREEGGFLFGGDDGHKPARVLSGGEKTRLALATLVVSAANVQLVLLRNFRSFY